MPTDPFTAPVFVTGIPGKALTETARLLQRQGYWTGVAEPDAIDLRFDKSSSNPVFRREIIDTFLGKLKIDPQQLRVFKGDLKTFVVNGMQNWVTDVLQPMGYAGQRWMYADPHLALLYVTFASAFPKAHWVISRQALQPILAELEQLELTPAKSHEEWLDYCGHLLHWLDAGRAGVTNQQEIWADGQGNISHRDILTLTNNLGGNAQHAVNVAFESASGTATDTGIESADENARPTQRPGMSALRHIHHYLTARPLEIADDADAGCVNPRAAHKFHPPDSVMRCRLLSGGV